MSAERDADVCTCGSHFLVTPRASRVAEALPVCGVSFDGQLEILRYLVCDGIRTCSVVAVNEYGTRWQRTQEILDELAVAPGARAADDDAHLNTLSC